MALVQPVPGARPMMIEEAIIAPGVIPLDQPDYAPL